ncbi:MAG: DUF3592 domain-containing protein [Hyphomicrobiaceae bacterium]
MQQRRLPDLPSFHNIFWAALAAALLYRLARAVIAVILWSRRSAFASGTVVGKTKRLLWSDTNRWPGLHLDVEFVDSSGIRHHLKSAVEDHTDMWGHWKIGNQVQIAYDPAEPSNSELTLAALPLTRKMSNAVFVLVHVLVLVVAIRVVTS